MTKLARPDGHPKLTSSHALRLLILLGIAILACITARSALSLGLFMVTSITAGTGWSGDFWSNEFPIMILAAIAGTGSFGIYKLVRILRK